MRGRSAVAILAAMAVQMSCGRAPSTRANADLRTGALRGANVLLVTIDEQRALAVSAAIGCATHRVHVFPVSSDL